MIIYCIWDELQAVQKPVSDIWRVVPTAAILWCCTYLQHKMVFGSLNCQISSLRRSGTAHTYQEQPPNKAHYFTHCWEPWYQKLEPQCSLAQGLQIKSILLSSKTVVDSLPCLTQDWAAKQFIATTSHHLPHQIPPRRATSPDFKVSKGKTFSPDSLLEKGQGVSAAFRPLRGCLKQMFHFVFATDWSLLDCQSVRSVQTCNNSSRGTAAFWNGPNPPATSSGPSRKLTSLWWGRKTRLRTGSTTTWTGALSLQEAVKKEECD